MSTEIDEGLYSRQLYVLGHEAMKKMSAASVLIVGLGGLGIEVAKNVVLSGVKEVGLYDKTLASLDDLSTQFYLTEEDIGKPRDQVSCLRLAELNNYVPVRVVDDLSAETLRQFHVIVSNEQLMSEAIELNEKARAHGSLFIASDVRGLFAFAFCDFGDAFVVSDATGEAASSGIVSAISAEGVVTCFEESRHGLESGDFVTFREVEGMQINDCEPREVKVLGPYSFSIGDVSSLGQYLRQGVFEQVKQPQTHSFASLKDNVSAPQFAYSDFGKMDRPPQLLVAFRALDRFVLEHKREPKPRNAQDAKLFLEMCAAISTDYSVDCDLKLLEEFSMQCAGKTAPMAAVLGGFVAQEVLKACTGKFSPLKQLLFFDALEAMPGNPTEDDCQPLHSRYDAQIRLFGRAFQEKLGAQTVFLVGAGAIGCEMLKNWALMGLGAGSGHIHVTDMDTIEKSNLNRQFLFRPWDVSRLKSETAVRAAQAMNPKLQGRVTAYSERVGTETEALYGDAFFGSLSFVTNALDNVDARMYMDRRCVFFQKALLESGTLGTKGNTQVVLPFLTESYASSRDPPEKSIPQCTLHNFPNQIEHTIQWALDVFHGLFNAQPESINCYARDDSFVETTKRGGTASADIFDAIAQNAGDNAPKSYADCVQWARCRFEVYFSDQLKQMLIKFPRDSLTSAGMPFWSGPKRAPTPLQFDPSNPLHLQFIIAAANLRAEVYGLTRNDIDMKETLAETAVPCCDVDAKPMGEDADVDALVAKLPARESIPLLMPAKFEKDDDANFHVAFVSAAANLRAANYEIRQCDAHKAKQVAGKIIPAIATTTALVTGLVNIEALKLVDGTKALDQYKNGFVNLALPFFGFSEPIAPESKEFCSRKWTLWDAIEIDGDLTLAELVKRFKDDYKLDVSMLSHGKAMLFGFMSKEKTAERMQMRISQIVETVSKQPLAPHVRTLVLEALVTDAEGEDVEIPYVKLRLGNKD